MQLELESQERDMLVWSLTAAISELQTEIAHTDNRDLHQDLKDRKTILEKILTRLGA